MENIPFHSYDILPFSIIKVSLNVHASLSKVYKDSTWTFKQSHIIEQLCSSIVVNF